MCQLPVEYLKSVQVAFSLSLRLKLRLGFRHLNLALNKCTILMMFVIKRSGMVIFFYNIPLARFHQEQLVPSQPCGNMGVSVLQGRPRGEGGSGPSCWGQLRGLGKWGLMEGLAVGCAVEKKEVWVWTAAYILHSEINRVLCIHCLVESWLVLTIHSTILKSVWMQNTYFLSE